MKAVVLPNVNAVEIRDVPAPLAAPGEAIVSLRAAALNHRDVWIRQGQYAGLKFPCTPGSDGSGIVTQVGSDADARWVGKEVIINPSFDWGSDPRAQRDTFTILGLPRNGTFAEQIAVPVEQLAEKPTHLSWEEAAALPLAGLTAYRALFTRARLSAGERVLISGIGGGVALFTLQLASAAGAEVWVTSGSEEKIQRARSFGAKGGFNYTEDGWAKKAAEQSLFHVIVDSAGGTGFEKLLDLAAPGARVVFYGATQGNPPVLPMRKIFWRQLNLLGSTMGSPEDWSELIRFVDARKIKPVVSDVFPLDRAAAAFDLMQQGAQFGKIVLRVS